MGVGRALPDRGQRVSAAAYGSRREEGHPSSRARIPVGAAPAARAEPPVAGPGARTLTSRLFLGGEGDWLRLVHLSLGHQRPGLALRGCPRRERAQDDVEDIAAVLALSDHLALETGGGRQLLQLAVGTLLDQ